MVWLAWRMLTGDRVRYVAIVFGISFSSLLIAQQFSIFCGVMLMTMGQLRDIEEADVWVVAPMSRHADDLKPLATRDVLRVRSVSGIAWAVPFYRSAGRAELEDGSFQQVVLLGLDDATLIGAPRELLVGELAGLDLPDGFLIDQNGYHLLWPGEPYETGKVLELNGRRSVLVGVCKGTPKFQTPPIVYLRLSRMRELLPGEEEAVSVVLAQGTADVTPEEVCERVRAETGLMAKTRQEFAWMTMDHYLQHTGLLLNFGTTVSLGFIVGVSIAGQNFYSFTVENLRYFATLKAMGARDGTLIGMVLLQAVTVGLLGYAIGVGLAAVFGEVVRFHTKLVFYMPWQVLVGTGVAVVLVVMLASLLSIRRVLAVEPAAAFRV